MTKILHTADIHLDSPLGLLALRNEDLRARVQAATRSAFERIVNAAISENVVALLISGDLFDGAARSARTAAFLTSQLDRLRASKIRVFCVKGNHDALNPISGEFSWPDNVTVFDNHGGSFQLDNNIWIHGVSYGQRHEKRSLLSKFPAPVDGAINIAMLHTSLSSTKRDDSYAPCSATELLSMGFDYWALGHVHGRMIHSANPWIVMPGTPQGRGIGETGPKTATIVTIGTAIEVDEIHTSVIEFLDVEVDATGVENDDSLRDLLRTRMTEIATELASDAAALRLTITGKIDRYWEVLRDWDEWKENIKGLAGETGCLWLDSLHFDLESKSTQSDQGAVGELAEIMEEIRKDPIFLDEFRTELRRIFMELSALRRKEIIPDEEAETTLTQRLSGEGAEMILALMRGGRDQ